MAQSKDGGNPAASRGGPRRREGRRRTVLNLGLPFLQVDDFINQSEDAVALGYRVLVETVEEIKKGYEEAKKFYAEQKDYDDGKTRTPPAIPWKQMVDRVQNIQNIGLAAVKDGTDIVVDSLKAGMKSTERLASTWEQSRKDVDDAPILAGPVFEDVIEITARQGEQPTSPPPLTVRHPGLMRLRIVAVVSPRPKKLKTPGEADYELESAKEFMGDIDVEFEPSRDPEKCQQNISELTITFGAIPSRQAPGVYEGRIRATNFELLIARLRIRVLAADGARSHAATPTSRTGPDRSRRGTSGPRKSGPMKRPTVPKRR